MVTKKLFLSVIEGCGMRAHLEERLELQEDIGMQLHEVNFEGVLGMGGFGVVYMGTSKTRKNRKYAVKALSIHEMQADGHDTMRLLVREKDILETLDHPFIIKFVKSFHDDRAIYLLTEVIQGGELFEALEVLGILSGEVAQFYTASLFVIFDYLHANGVIYRDLKPENILLDTQGYFKLIDFGLAKMVAGVNERSYTVVGTAQFMAPENILGKGFSVASDIWAIGICFYDFVSGQLPFSCDDDEDQVTIFRLVISTQPSFDPSLPWATTDLITRLLRKEPTERIGMSTRRYDDIKEHEFFNGFNYNELLGRQIQPPFQPAVREAKDLQKHDLAADARFPPCALLPEWADRF